MSVVHFTKQNQDLWFGVAHRQLQRQCSSCAPNQALRTSARITATKSADATSSLNQCGHCGQWVWPAHCVDAGSCSSVSWFIHCSASGHLQSGMYLIDQVEKCYHCSCSGSTCRFPQLQHAQQVESWPFQQVNWLFVAWTDYIEAVATACKQANPSLAGLAFAAQGASN